MFSLGLIFAVCGFLSWIYASRERDTAAYLLASVFDAKEAAQIDWTLYLGIVALIIGIALMVAHFICKDHFN